MTDGDAMADAVLEIVTNAANPLGEEDSKELETDSDAVLCKGPLLVRYAQNMLARPGVLWFCQAWGFVMFAGRSIGGRLVDDEAEQPLAMIQAVCMILSLPLMGLTMFSLRRCTREGVGQLAELGMDRVQISLAAATHLQRWALVLTFVTCGPILLGALFNAILFQAVLGRPSPGNPSHIGLTELTPEKRLTSFVFGVQGLTMAPLVLGWWLALKTASVLVSDIVRISPHLLLSVCVCVCLATRSKIIIDAMCVC